MPTRRQLAERFRSSLPAIQQAFTILEKEGFVRSQGTLGTFVNEHPPHLSRYALVFPTYPGRGAHWPRFWTALANEAASQQADGLRVPVFHGVEGREGAEGFLQLAGDIASHRLAGLIFAWPPGKVMDTALVTAPGIPRVGIMKASAQFPHFSTVSLNLPSFTEKALGYLASRGRRRIAVIGTPGQDLEGFVADATAHQFVTHDHWVQCLPFDSPPESGRQLALLLMHPGQTERPDGLVIMDDNLVEAVTSGLVKSGVNLPRDLDVVGHCNFPWPTPSVLPIKRLGFDARQVLRACVHSIQSARHNPGERPVAMQVESVFEDDLERVSHP